MSPPKLPISPVQPADLSRAAGEALAAAQQMARERVASISYTCNGYTLRLSGCILHARDLSDLTSALRRVGAE